MARHLLLLLLVISAAGTACGGGDDEPEATATPAASATPEATIVTSDDGKLSLSIPSGAMPEGTEVTITAVPQESLPAELSQLVGSAGGYELQPDGLTLSEPATATQTMDRTELDDPDGQQTAYALVSYSDTAGREVLDSETATILSEGTTTVTAEVTHFSFIARTKSSLLVALEGHEPTRAAGETYQLGAYVENARPSDVSLESVSGRWIVGGVITAAQESFELDNLGSEYVVSGMNQLADFTCEAPGTGDNGVRVSVTSKVVNNPDLVTTLAVTVGEHVTCVEGTVEPGLPTATPDAGMAVVHLTQTLGCEHTQPGVQSELRKRGRVTSSLGDPLAGVRVTEEATGPGLVDPSTGEPVPSAIGVGVTDENGAFTITWIIKAFGPYATSVTRVQRQDMSDASLDATSTPTVNYEVGQTCTPP
jgi:hypothetical protein